MKTSLLPLSKIIGATAALMLAFQAQAATHIFASKLITSQDSKSQSDMTVIVDNNKIIKIVEGKDEGGEGDVFIDLSGSTLMPGLMDMHVHLSFQNEGPSSYMKRFTSNEADYAIAAVDYAEKTLILCTQDEGKEKGFSKSYIIDTEKKQTIGLIRHSFLNDTKFSSEPDFLIFSNAFIHEPFLSSLKKITSSTNFIDSTIAFLSLNGIKNLPFFFFSQASLFKATINLFP